MTNQNPDDALLRLCGMRKSFPGVLANDNVDLALRPGEVRALLGENGAGKSTLVKMIYGILRADAGEIHWRDSPGAPARAVQIANPAQARELGIAMVFQHFSLFDSLSVLDNIALGMDAKILRGMNLREQIRDISERYGLPLDPARHVYTLSVGERQRIEIIRCLLQHPKLLVMDEPTSVLTPQEVEKLFQTLERLAEEGLAILYISHKLDEIKRLCRNATILRNGKVVADVEVAAQTPATLAAKMIGEELSRVEIKRAAATFGEVRLRVDALNLPAADEFGMPLRDIHLQVRAGEILGIAGVAGNGQDELLKALSGEVLCEPEAIVIDAAACGAQGANARRMMGLATVPEERLGHAAVPSMNLADNALLTAFMRLRLVSRGFIKTAAGRRFARDVMARFHVKANGVDAPAASLSGGNLQKFIVGREICQAPELLVVSQPTWGVDAGAAIEIRRALRELADQGAAVLIISQDLDELMELSDSIAAICAGRLSALQPTAETTLEQIGLLMAGAQSDVAPIH